MSKSVWAKMPTRVVVIAAAGLAMFAVSACDSTPAGPVAGPDGPIARQVTVVGSGKVQGAPDTVTVNAAIESSAPDATTAMNQTNERMAAVIDAVAGQGIDREDISTEQVSLQPQYADDAASIRGYTASNSIAVKVRSIDAASPTITAIQTTGGNATRINSVSFAIEDDSQLVKDARARAFADAKDRAGQYAKLSGMSLGKVISITESGAGAPPPMPSPRYGALEAAVPLEPGQQTVGFSVTVVWELG